MLGLRNMREVVVAMALGSACAFVCPGLLGAEWKQAQGRRQTPRVEEQQEETVMFNTQSRKYHCPQCEWAIKCTKNCVPMSLKRAQELGGIPCSVCGGRCR